VEAPRVEVHAEFVLRAPARAARDPLGHFVTNEVLTLVLHPRDHRRGISLDRDLGEGDALRATVWLFLVGVRLYRLGMS